MSVIALASILATQGQVTLLYQPKVGATYKYSNTTVQSSPMGGGSQTVSSTTTMKVLSLTGGYYNLSVGTSNVKITGGQGNADQMKKMMEGKPMTMSIDKYGAPKKDGKGMAPGMQQMMNNLGSQGGVMMFPKKAIKVGDTWSNTIDLGSAVGSMMKGQGNAPKGMKSTGKLTTTYKLIKLDGSSATIASTMKGAMDMDMGAGRGGPGGGQGMKMSMTLGATGQYTVEKATGTMVNSTMKMDIGVMGQKMTNSMTIKRI